MKRIIDLLYGNKAPQSQSALWLKQTKPYTGEPYINDNGTWVPFNIDKVGTSLTYNGFYKASNVIITTLDSFLHSNPISFLDKDIDIYSDKIYLYIALPSRCYFEKALTEYGEDVLEYFNFIESSVIHTDKGSLNYTLYCFSIPSPSIPLDANISISISSNENS